MCCENENAREPTNVVCMALYKHNVAMFDELEDGFRFTGDAMQSYVLNSK